ncbi:MAG: hypothetical protein IPJ49_25105 [Candidatus Obscuribacter sp.]|nr:hypothetical protein [Candidatus Obscuribacter sp.]
MSPDNKPDERYTRDSLFKAKLTDIRRQERKKTEETKKDSECTLQPGHF